MYPFRILIFSKKQVSPTYYANIGAAISWLFICFQFILCALNAPRPPLSNAPKIFENGQDVEKLQPKH